MITLIHHVPSFALTSVLFDPEACSRDAWSTHWNLPGSCVELSTHWVLSSQPQPDGHKTIIRLAVKPSVSNVWSHWGKLRSWEGPWSAEMRRKLGNRMPAVALPSALSCLDSRADVTLALHPSPTPSCSGSTLGVLPRGWSQIAVSAWVRQPGSRQAPWHRNEVSQGWIPGRLLLIRAWRYLSHRHHRLFPKGKTWVGTRGGRGGGGSWGSQRDVLPV